MPLTPDRPFPKSAGDAVRSKDWNDLVIESQRLDTAKVDRAGDAITGPLSIAGALAVGKASAAATAKLDVAGDLRINDSNLYLRGGSDPNHGLGWFGSGKLFGGVNIDGPVLWGNAGGALGSALSGTQIAALNWDNTGRVGIGTASPKAALHVVGPALVSDGDGYAVPNNRMAKGSLTIGSLTSNFGGGTGWNANTAGLLLETLDDTEIAVHDSGTRVASVVQYQSADNSLTIGRDMGWGAISAVVVGGALRAGNSDLYFTKIDHDHTGFGNTAGYAAIENTRNYDALMLLGRANAQHPMKPGIKTRVVKLWDFLEVNGDMRVTGQINSSMFKATTLMSSRAGALPLSTVFASSGGTLLVFASGTGFRSGGGGTIGMMVRIDNMVMSQVKGFTNESNSHKAFPPSFSVVTSIGAGSHTLDIIPLDASTATDFNDYFNVMVLELPFR